MQIQVEEVPNCTWALIGTKFYCMHDADGIRETVEQDLHPDQHFNSKLHLTNIITCIDCGEDITEASYEPSY